MKVIRSVVRLSALIRKQTSRELGRVGLKPVDFIVLKTLSARPTTPNTLASQLGLTKAAITYIADKLEAKGVVRRERQPGDRRHVSLVLTKKGARTLKRAERLYTRTLQRKLESLSQQELESLGRTIEKLAQLFSKPRGK